MIELKNLIKSYSNVVAVDDITFKVEKGEVVGLLGPNGAGKSTTMKLITGFLVPDEGEILIDGVNVQDNPIETKAKIGYMPENNPLYKEMLVKDALEFSADLHSVPNDKQEERIRYAVKATGLQSVYYRPIGELSKGYKQRVGLAQVLISDPEILILDEPTEGLDPNQRNEIRELIKSLGKDRTVIVSTHVMQEVEAMCNRIIIINNGKVIADGSQKTILKSDNAQHIIVLNIEAKNNITKDNFSSIKTDRININKKEDNLYEVELVVSGKDIFDKISEVIKKNDWVMRGLVEKKANLEEVFRKLTVNN